MARRKRLCDVASRTMTRNAGLLLLLPALLGALLAHPCAARPTVREIRNNREFERLLKHHKEMTGLPVIVDYYSDGCGPCRQIAPHFKKLAKKYKGKAVFAKVNVDRNRETSGRQQIRSMPTFQAYLLGKKRQQFSGADLRQLQSISQQNRQPNRQTDRINKTSQTRCASGTW